MFDKTWLFTINAVNRAWGIKIIMICLGVMLLASTAADMSAKLYSLVDL
jgi:hypothetical protein